MVSTSTPADHPVVRPIVRLRPKAQARVLRGHPWIYSNEVAMDAPAKALERGTVASFLTANGEFVGAGYFNPHSLIAGRLLSRHRDTVIDAAFFRRRLEAALALRQRLFDRPFYRLVHAEADGLPGLVIDRFDDVVVMQANAAGAECATADILAALDAVLAPRAVVLRNDSPARTLEGLDLDVRLASGRLDGPVALEENGVRFLIDPAGGQKTGWFFDHRDNRAFVARLASGARVLDAYTFAGAFAVQCAVAGARQVVALDRSQPALDLAARAAAANGVADRIEFRRAEAFAELERLSGAGERFDVVIADPPAFVKSKKDLNAGLRGYRKLTRLAASLVAPEGVLLVASCSHAVSPADFAVEVARGLHDAGREGRIIRSAGAAADHPVHPQLPESAYLKALVLALD